MLYMYVHESLIKCKITENNNCLMHFFIKVPGYSRCVLRNIWDVQGFPQTYLDFVRLSDPIRNVENNISITFSQKWVYDLVQGPIRQKVGKMSVFSLL